MVRRKCCTKTRACAVTFTVSLLLLVNILAVHQLSKSDPDHFVHTYGSLYGGHQMVVRSCRPIGLSSTLLPLTALASYPGSGNTWLRHLIQQATGLATGSEYVDLGLKLYGFPGEGIGNGSVLVIKTHESSDSTLHRYSKAIVLIRKPQEAMLAEFNRRYGGHLGHAQKIHFKIEWKQFLLEEMERWFAFNSRWSNYYRPLKLVNFHDLETNTSDVLRSVLDFLNIAVTDSELFCAMKNGKGIFKRPGAVHNYSGKNLFTPTENLMLERYWNHIFLEYNKGEKIRLSKEIRS